jgi:hemoglobin/transferrin/lactoferrin receptor protein
MTAFARLSPRATVRVGLFNLTDAAYVEWPTIRGLADTAANRAVLDAFTSPGRNVTVSLTLGF